MIHHARALLLAGLLTGVGFALAPPLTAQQEAQEKEGADEVLVRGRVLDAVTQQPIAGAFVGPADADEGVLTDSLGNFALKLPPVRVRSLTAEQMGYVMGEITYQVENEEEPVVILLEPDPVLLEGIRIVSDRLQSRRNAVAVSVQAFDQEDLLRTPLRDAAEFVRWNAGGHFQRCTTSGLAECVYTRGRVQPVRVCIDDFPAIGGMHQLSTYWPQEFYVIEVYQRGRVVRAYTPQFVERLAKQRAWLPPVGIGC
jgi:hypothetical protein